MAFTLTTTQAGASADYQRYIIGTPEKVDHVNEPSHLTFSVAPIDAAFVKLTRGAYMTFSTATYGHWFTGYVTNEPQLTYLGTKTVAGVRTPVWGYNYTAISDEYLLNLKPVGIMPPFINTTHGAIIKYIANQLVPGGFTVTNVQNGLNIARYVADPTASFSDIVQDFCTQAYFRFWAKDKALNFVAYDNTSPLTIDGNDKHFTPSQLNIQMIEEQVVNDAVVLGDIEPQNYMYEFFIGDGTTGTYPLASSVYGADSTILLTDDFANSSIDTTKWNIVNTASNFIQVANGYVNVLGGANNNSYDTHLDAVNLIPIEGNLRLTHGEWDFVSASSGFICGVWTQAPNSAQTGCVYALACSKVSTNTVINPVVNGTLDSTQSITIDSTKRYVIRTLLTTDRTIRFANQFGFVNSNGTVGSTAASSNSVNAVWNTTLTPIDPTTGTIGAIVTFNNTAVVSTMFGLYIPLADNDLHVTFTGPTISAPIQANLQTRTFGTYSYVPKMIGPNEIDALDGLAPAATIIDSNNGTTTNSTLLQVPQYNPGAAILQYFRNSVNLTTTLPNKGDLILLSYRRPGSAIAHVRNNALIASESTAWGDDGLRSKTFNNLTPMPRTSDEAEQAGLAILKDAGYQHFQGSYSMLNTFSFTAEPVSGQMVKFANLPQPPFSSSLQAELITEVHSKFVSGLSGERFEHAITFGKIDRTKQLLAQMTNPPDVFMPADTTTLPSYIDFSAVGLAFAPDITTQPSLLLFDKGNVVQNNDFELLGQYWSTSATAGTSVTFVNNPANAHSGNDYLELTSATTGSVFVSAVPTTDIAGTVAAFYPVTVGDVVTFGGWINNIAGTSGQIAIATLDASKAQVSSFAVAAVTAGSGWTFRSTTATIPSGIAYIQLIILINGTPINPSTTRYDGLFLTNSNRLYIGTNVAPVSGGGFQVRYTDDSWGADAARNLVVQTSDQIIAVPRNNRGKTIFIRQFDTRNKLLWSEDQTQAGAWSIGAGVTRSLTQSVNLDNDVALATTVTWGNTVNDFIDQASAITAASTLACFTVNVKGPVGNQIRLVLQASGNTQQVGSTVFTLTGGWQRLSVSGTFLGTATGVIQAVVFRTTAGVFSIQMSKTSLEIGTATETVYCKTTSTTFGAMSRNSVGIRSAYPLIPAVPTASINTINVNTPVVTVGLPANLSDVWGVEIRGSDDLTVLYKKDLIDANYLPQASFPGNTASSLTYITHTYNLLNEYSTGVTVSTTIAPPALPALPSTTKNLVYNGNFATYTTPTGFVTSTASSVRTDDHDNGGSLRQSADGWTRNFEGSGGVCYRADLSGFGFSPNGTYGFILQDAQGVLGSTFAAVSDAFPVSPNTPYTLSAAIFPGIGSGVPTHAIYYYRAVFYKNSTTDFTRSSATLCTGVPSILPLSGFGGNNPNSTMLAGVAGIIEGASVSGSFNPATVITTPTDAAYCRIAFYHWSDGTSPAIAWNYGVGNVQMTPVITMELDVADGTTRFAGAQAGSTGDGFQILSNPDFAGGSLTGYTVYDNLATGHVVFSAVADSAAPNSSGWKLHIAVSAGGESPGFGGFTRILGPDSGPFTPSTYHRGSTIIWRIRANIPVGYSINQAANATGTPASFTWLTPQAGTGAFYEYVGKEIIGTSGTFSSTGFYYITGPATFPFSWDVAVCSAVCITHPAGFGVSDVDPNRRAVIDFTQTHLSKNQDNVTDGVTFGRALVSRLSSGKPLIDFSEGIHLNKNQDNVTDGTTFGRVNNTALTGNNIDPSKAGFRTKGSTPVTLSTSNPFTYTSTSTTITLNWVAITIYRTDNTTSSIASGSQLITGLTFTAPQAYTFFPYYDEALGTMVFMTRAGANGSPAIAYTTPDPVNSQLQNLQGRIPLGLVNASTAVGSGLGSGGGGSPGGCLWHKCVVLHKDRGIVELGSCQVGDWILGKAGIWTQIKSLEIVPCEEWVLTSFDNDEGLISTVGHPTPLIDGTVSRACNIGLGTFIPSCNIRDGVYSGLASTTPTEIKLAKTADLIAHMVCDHEHDERCAEECGDGHLFYAGMKLPIILTHNGIVPSQ